MASQNPRRLLPAWPHCALVPKSPTPRVMPEHPTIPEADWHLLFDAVKYRLSATVFSTPATAVVAVAECVEALDWLQRQLPRAE